jgi:hypothetical protein
LRGLVDYDGVIDLDLEVRKLHQRMNELWAKKAILNREEEEETRINILPPSDRPETIREVSEEYETERKQAISTHRKSVLLNANTQIITRATQ